MASTKDVVDHHLKCFGERDPKGILFVTLRIIWHTVLRAIWHNRALRGSASDELASVGSLHS